MSQYSTDSDPNAIENTEDMKALTKTPGAVATEPAETISIPSAIQLEDRPLARFLHRREFDQMFPPDDENLQAYEDRARFFNTMLRIIFVSGVSLLVMSAVVTIPEFAALTPAAWEMSPLGFSIAASISGGFGVIGYELFSFIAGALVRSLPVKVIKDHRYVLFATVTLAVLIGVVANLNSLLAPYLRVATEQRLSMLNIWPVFITLVFGIGRYALLVLVGDVWATLRIKRSEILQTITRKAEQSRKKRQKQYREDFDRRGGRYLTMAREAIRAGLIPLDYLQENPALVVSMDSLTPAALAQIVQGGKEISVIEGKVIPRLPGRLGGKRRRRLPRLWKNG